MSAEEYVVASCEMLDSMVMDAKKEIVREKRRDEESGE